MKLYIGDTIKRLRQQNGLTQEKLAEKLGVSFQSVSRWEGGTSYPDIELIPEIARFFNVTTDELMGLEKTLMDKKLEEALKRIEGDIPLKERLVIQRQIHHDFPFDSGVLYGMINTLGELCEEGNEGEYYEELKKLSEEYLALPADNSYYKDQVKTELITAAPEEETDAMIKKYASEFDMRSGALLKKRYEYRGDKELCEAQIQANLVDTIHNIVFDNFPSGNDAVYASRCQTKALQILNILSGNEKDGLIPPAPDMWSCCRLWLGVRLAMSLCQIPDQRSAALGILEMTVVLAESISSLSDGTVLNSENGVFPSVSVCVSLSSPSKLYNYRHPLFIYQNQGKEFKKNHAAFRPEWLNRREFDPIREDLRFLGIAERIRNLTKL